MKIKTELALSLFALSVFVAGYFIFTSMNWLLTPDTRTVEEIKVDRYKECLKWNNADHAEWCKNFIK